ncbi:hypothetical protein BHE74_00017788 [Ensete ventricosum]|nr:hypothetical protein BHE74_00017788 [Ensete ventricosum]
MVAILYKQHLHLKSPMDLFSSFVSLAAAVVGLLLLASRTWAALNSNRKRYPPVVGTIFHQFLNFRRLHDYHTQLSLKHKTFRLLSPLCHQFYTTDPAVVEYILKTNFDNYGKEGRDDILSRFLEESGKDPQNIDFGYLRDIILNFVIAGKDTTAGTLSWFFYSICKNPPVQEKVYQEIKEVIEASEDAAFDAFAESIDDESLNKMHYLHAALSETLRLYPAVPLENKVCFSDDILPGGYNVREGDIVFYQPYAMGRMEYLWGKDAEIFRPERWLDDGGVFQPESPYKFSAFQVRKHQDIRVWPSRERSFACMRADPNLRGYVSSQAGPRICLGKEFAYRQMKIFAAVLLRFFKFKLGDEKKDVEYRTTTTLHIDQGLFLQVLHR